MIRVLRLAAALAATLALAAPAAAQTAFEPAAVVNGQVITNYDVEQQLRLNMLSAGVRRPTEAMRRAALESLIEDTLRVAAAARMGMRPEPGMAEEGVRRLAAQNRIPPEALLRSLDQAGVDRSAFERQLTADILWSALILRRYGSRAAVSEQRVARAMAQVEQTVTAAETRYRLVEIQIPGDRRAADAVMRRLISGERFNAVAAEISAAPSASRGGDIGWVTESDLPDHGREAILRLTMNQISPPVPGPGGHYIYGLRALDVPGGDARFTLKQLVVAAPLTVSPDRNLAARAQAEAARLSMTSCERVDALAPRYARQSGDVPPMTLTELPGPIRVAVADLDIGDVSAPVRSQVGWHVVIVCDKTASTQTAAPVVDRRLQVESDLVDARLSRFARSLLQELRRDAVIEYR